VAEYSWAVVSGEIRWTAESPQNPLPEGIANRLIAHGQVVKIRS
jgi:hypothetical protein